jgi:hypothetical protein
MTTDLHPAVAALRAVSRDYPGCWKAYDGFRQDRRELGDWPEWCYCPMAAAYAIASGGGPNRLGLDRIGEVARLAALAAWRPTQGIYRFDPDLRAALTDAPLKGELPCELLYRLPAWCVYLEDPLPDTPGVFAHLEWDMNQRRAELRLLFVAPDGGLLPLPLHLGRWDLGVAMDEMARQARQHAVTLGMPAPGKVAPLATLAAPVVSLLLYLAADQADYQRPGWPEPKRTKDKAGGKVWKLFPPKHAEIIDVGVRMGAALRRGPAPPSNDPADGTHASPRPHIRAAHWHLYWTGPKTGDQPQQPRVLWIPPTGVNLDQGAIAPTIRPVQP